MLAAASMGPGGGQGGAKQLWLVVGLLRGGAPSSHIHSQLHPPASCADEGIHVAVINGKAVASPAPSPPCSLPSCHLLPPAPHAGEGIHTAMMGGKAAAQTILDMRRTGDFSKQSCKAFERRCGCAGAHHTRLWPSLVSWEAPVLSHALHTKLRSHERPAGPASARRGGLPPCSCPCLPGSSVHCPPALAALYDARITLLGSRLPLMHVHPILLRRWGQLFGHDFFLSQKMAEVVYKYPIILDAVSHCRKPVYIQSPSGAQRSPFPRPPASSSTSHSNRRLNPTALSACTPPRPRAARAVVAVMVMW